MTLGWVLFALGLVVHLAGVVVLLERTHRGRRIPVSWRLGRERRPGRGWVWVAMAGYLLMAFGSGVVTDGPGPLAVLVFSGSAVGAVVEVLVAVVHNRRLGAHPIATRD
jgi:hypothetical protein